MLKKFQRSVRGLDEKKDDDIEKQYAKAPSQDSECYRSPCLGTNVMPKSTSRTRTSRPCKKSNTEAFTTHPARVEDRERIGLSRSVSIDKLHEHQDEVRRRSFGRAWRASMTVPEARRSSPRAFVIVAVVALSFLPRRRAYADATRAATRGAHRRDTVFYATYANSQTGRRGRAAPPPPLASSF